MKKRAQLDMERGIVHSFQSSDKFAFRELKMTTRVINQYFIDSFFRLDKNLIIYQIELIF